MREAAVIDDGVVEAAGKKVCQWIALVSKPNVMCPIEKDGRPVDCEQRDGDGHDGDVARGRGGGMKQRDELVVVEKNVVASKLTIQVANHHCAR